MQWHPPSISHVCHNTSLSVVALCNAEPNGNHFLVIGSDEGQLDLINLETDLSFYGPKKSLSLDSNNLIYVDFESNDRGVIGNSFTSFTFTDEFSPIYACNSSGIFQTDFRTPASLLFNCSNVDEVCIAPDNHTLFALQYSGLSMTDIRNPTTFIPLGCQSEMQRALLISDHNKLRINSF